MEGYDRFESERGSGGTFVMGLLAGTVLGASLGILFAPKSGSELRGQLAERAGNLKDSAAENARKAAEAASERYKKATDAVTDTYTRVTETASDAYKRASAAAREGYKSATDGHKSASDVVSDIAGNIRS